MACSVGTPSGLRNSTNAPSRTPRPEMLMGSTWAMSDGGEEGEQRGGPGGDGCRGPGRRPPRPAPAPAGRRSRRRARWPRRRAGGAAGRGRGGRRRRTAASPSRRRTVRRSGGWPRRRGRRTSSTSVPHGEGERHAGWRVPRWRSPGLTRKPTKVMTGSTSQPVSRSSTTEAKRGRGLAVVAATGARPAARRRRWWWAARWPRTGRRGSATAGAAAARGSRAPSSTACHRTAESTMPTSVRAAAARSHHAVPSVHSGDQVGDLEVGDLQEQDGEHHHADRDPRHEGGRLPVSHATSHSRSRGRDR